MYQSFSELVSERGDAPAVFEPHSGTVTPRRELLVLAGELADHLAERGVGRQDVVAMQLPNSAAFVAGVLANFKLGAVLLPIDRDAPPAEVEAVLAHFDVRALLFGGTPRVDVSIRRTRAGAVLPDAARLLKLTSGSSGRPRAIVCSEANLIADCQSICRTMEIGPGDINLGAIPFSHSYGFSNLVTPLLMQGTPVVASNDYLPLSLIELSNRYGCTVAPLIPMVFEHLASLPLSDGRFTSVRTYISAGAPLSAATSLRFRTRFDNVIHSFYGCSECGGITYDRRGAAAERGTVGEPLEDVRLTVSEKRLTVTSDAVALGWMMNSQSFMPLPDSQFQTDDIVEMAGAELVLAGRASDVINTAGKKVNPREVERVILQIEGVTDARVYGEQAGARGEVVAAVIVASPEVTREQVRAFCRERLSLHKVPRIVKLTNALPVDERGKVKRAALSAL